MMGTSRLLLAPLAPPLLVLATSSASWHARLRPLVEHDNVDFESEGGSRMVS